jgi:pyruvate dehydrogenase E2 component (dihydrolipoamide acetyltransferase)
VGKKTEIKVPDIGDFEGVPVIEVLVSEGDEVEKEQSLITLESDKATMEVPSPTAGKIVELKVSVDDKVSEGDVVAIVESGDEEGEVQREDAKENVGAAQADSAGAVFGEAERSAGDVPSRVPRRDRDAEGAEETQGEAEEDKEKEQDEEKEDPEAKKEKEEEKPASRRPPPAKGLPSVDPEKVPYASPAIRRFARELGVDLLRVKGSGRGGRIVREDVTKYVKSRLSQPEGGGALPFDLPPLPKVDFSKYGETETVELSRIRKKSGANVHRNWVTIPHVTHHDEADITDLEAFRKSQAESAEAQGYKLTPLVFLIKASVAALKQFLDFNASLDPSGEYLIRKEYFNIGIAVDTPEGLVVPVLRNCQAKGIMELAKELSEVSEKAREGKLSPAEMSGGCFSISSLGGIGGTGFSPIINAPEVAILGVSRHKMRAMWDGEGFKPRLMLPISLSYDHRVIDGASAARFTRYLASRLEDLRRLTL